MGCARFRPLNRFGAIETGCDVKGRVVLRGGNATQRKRVAECPDSSADREANDHLS